MNNDFNYPVSGIICKADLKDIKHALHVYVSGGSKYEIKCAKAWGEKLIRLVEINRRNLPTIYEKRFSSKKNEAIILTYQMLTASTLLYGKKKHIPYPDLRAVNAALYLRDSSSIKKLIRVNEIIQQTDNKFMQFIANLLTLLQSRGTANWCEDKAPPPDFPLPAKQIKNNLDNESFLILSPNPYSLNTITTLWTLKKRGAKVSALAIRRMISVQRIREELNFSPRRLITRVFNEILFRGDKKVSSDAASLARLMKSLNCQEANAISLAKKMGAKILQVDNFNSIITTNKFKKQLARYAIFTGGGIIKKETLSAFEGGIIHCHPGILPQYKGMDVVQWAILEGSFDQVGSTCQLMSQEIDGGEIIDNFVIDPREYCSISEIRTAVVEKKVALAVDTAIDLITEKRKPIAHPCGGKQYFLMHTILDKICTEYQETTVSKMRKI